MTDTIYIGSFGYFTTDHGHLVYRPGHEVYRDEIVPGIDLKPGVNAPNTKVYAPTGAGGTDLPHFGAPAAISEDGASGVLEINHDMAPGAAGVLMYPHAHWGLAVAPTAGDYIDATIKGWLSAPGKVFAGPFTSATKGVLLTGKVAGDEVLMEFDGVDISTYPESVNYLFVITRKYRAANNYPGSSPGAQEAALLFIDAHYKANSLGTVERVAPFTK